ncbi:MFS transporter [Streptomyces europaeiscabiei]|uniref:MFS transporter n=1 Tax=Streptomyces europaeiscabiei TaxID=146819 RepID=A0AAJ2PQA4_9ACTN|nr:MFS transporter [Streptomyces europaeiscabiei]MDX3131379.1 MFS transporter [Streptomyces europaeiscabiei]
MSPNPHADVTAPGNPAHSTGSLRAYMASLRGYPAAAWKSAIACVLAMALSPAASSATITFFVGPVARDFGWSQSQTLTMLNIPLIASPLILPLAGRWVDRWGTRAVAVPCVALYGLFTAAIALAGGNAVLLLLPMLASSLCGYIGIMGLTYKVVAEWFPRHRGMGYSLFIGGATSLGGAVIAPLFQLSIDGFGWRQTYLLFALCILAIAFPAQYFLLSEPTRNPADAVARKDGRGTGELPGMPLGAVLRSRAWLLMVTAIVLTAGVATSVRSNAVSLFGDRGYSATTVSLSLSVLLVASFVGMFLAGVAMDRSRSPRAFVPFVACLVVGTVSIFAATGGTWTLLLAMALLGVVMGAESSVAPYLAGRYFGMRAFAQVQGITLIIITLLGVGLTPTLVQAAAESTGSYNGPLIALTAVSVLTLALALLLPRYPAGEKHEPAAAADEAAQPEAV